MARKRKRSGAPATAPTTPRRVPDAGPPERARHGDTEVRDVFDGDTGRHLGRGRRAVAPIERLRGSLEPQMVNAAERYRRDWAEANGDRGGDPGQQNDRVDRWRGEFSPPDWQIDASRRLVAAQKSLTTLERPVVDQIIGAEQPVDSFSAYARINPQRVIGILSAALSRLAAHYGERRKAA